MKREVPRIVHVEVAGWVLNIWRVGDYLPAELESPDGPVAWARPLATSLNDEENGVFPSLRAFFAVRALDHVGVALIEQARAEIEMSGAVA